MSLRQDIKDSAKNLDLDIDVVRGLSARAIIEFLVVTILLCAAGYAAHCHIMGMLNNSLKENVSRHVGTISYSVEHEFDQQLNQMHIGASMVEHNQVSVEDLISVSNAFEDGTDNTSVLRVDGTAVIEKLRTLPEHEFKELMDVFDGKDIIAYHKGQGLIFAVPIVVNGEKCAFYQQYSDSELPELFGIKSYDGEGRITLGSDKSKEWTEISLGRDDGKYYNELYRSPGFVKKYADAVVWDTLVSESGHRIIKLFEYDGESYLIFGSKLKNFDFTIFGMVRREAVSAGVDYIHTVMLGVVMLTLLVIIMFGRYTIKNAENHELRQERLMALQASQTKSEFLSNMSHEIRTPINAILGMDEMILRESKEPTTLEYAENLRHAGNSLLGIINDILDFSKIEAGKMEIIPVEYQLSSLLNDLVNMIHTRADKKSLKFIANANQKIPSILFGDEIRIKQVITNILTNAVKYTEKGSVTLEVDYKEKGTDSIILEVSIKDTGMGIKEEDIHKLFSAFERIEEKRNRTIEGTGLGMNITQQLLHLMGTTLKVESVYGQGSTFSFELEQRIVNREPIGDFEEAFRNSLKDHKEYREKFTAPDAEILVVDDTVMNLTVVKGLLKQTKIKIDTAESGYECLDMAMKKKYDLIFLDHRMPGMDGMETLHEMQMTPNNPNADTPVISLTANAISGAREQYLAAGFKDYLTKPINSVHLENMLIKYLPKDKVKISDESSNETNLNETDDSLSVETLPEWLTKVQGLDIREGVEHCGDSDLYLEALTVFANAIDSGANEIENYYKAEDWKNYTTKVHALKSSSRVIGANELSEKAKRLEDAGNSGYIDEIKQDTAPLLKLYRSYAEKLKPLIKSVADSNDDDKPLIDDVELAEAFEAMKDAAATFDYDSMMFIFQSLDEYRLPENETKRYKNIKEATTKLDWTLINSLLNEEKNDV